MRNLYRLLGLVPENYSLYKIAFTHSSFTSEIGTNNERMELLGDAVFDVVVSEYLYHKYPFRNEGFLSEMRAKIVSRKQINLLAKKIGLQHFIETTLSEPALLKSSTIGNAFEALIGAIYLDKGFGKCKRFIERQVLNIHFEVDSLENKVVNFKSKMFHFVQKNDKKIEFITIDEETTEQGKIYTVNLLVDNELIAQGKGFNKKSAEQHASENACIRLEL